MPTRNVVLSDYQHQLVETLVHSGRYQNASEVLRDGLRLVEQQERLEAAKLPFASPDEPVSQARAEWLRTQGRDPFTELVVPATAIRLAQWVGRAIRTEEDMAHVYCYDKRLTRTSYGQRLLKGLPPFALEQRGPL